MFLKISLSLSLIIFVLYSHTTIQTPLFIHIIHVVLHINMECVNLGLVASDGLDNVCFNGTVVARLTTSFKHWAVLNQVRIFCILFQIGRDHPIVKIVILKHLNVYMV